MVANCFSLVSDWSDTFNKLFTGSGPKTDLAWHRWSAIGAGFTAQHHSLVTYQGHGMVQHQWMRCHGCKLLQFGLRMDIYSILLTCSCPKTDLAWHRWSTRSWFHSTTSLIGHIPRPWNGPAPMDEVSWLQTASVWSQNGHLFHTFDLLLPKN
jgi:hypothetical protein